MSNFVNVTLKTIEKIKNKGFFEIFFSSAIVKILMFSSAMFLPRFLSIEEYALLTYSETIVNYFFLLSGLGLSASVLKKCSCEGVSIPEKKGYFVFASMFGTGFNFLIFFVYLFVVFLFPFKIAYSKYIVLYMLFLPPLAFLFQNLQYYLRADFNNKKYSILTIVYTTVYVGMQVGLTVLWGVKGTVLSRYIAYFLSIAVGLFFVKYMLRSKIQLPKRQEKKDMISFSFVLLIGSFFSTVLINNEILLSGTFFSDMYLSQYKVASYILQICVFFVEAIIIFIMPYFSRHADDKIWIWRNYKKVFFFNAIFMTVIVAAFAIFSKYFVLILWGRRYMAAVPIIKRLLVAAWCQTVLRAIPGNVLAFTGGERFTLTINIVTFVLHIAVDFVIFKCFGEAFWGLGLIVAYAFSGGCMMLKVRRMCRNEY